MAKYRKKPVVVEAEQWPGITCGWVPKGCHFASGALICPTLEGNMTVSIGDWIITGVAGEKYPIKDAIFRKTYDIVHD